MTPPREDGVEVWNVRAPNNVPLPTIHLAIQDSVRGHGGQILFAKSEPISHRVMLHVGLMDSCLFVLDLRPDVGAPPEKGRIALIIDDFGDHWDETRRAFVRLNRSLTYSVMPGRPLSRQTAQAMIRAGYEIILQAAGFRDTRVFRETMTFVSTDEEEWWQQMLRLGWDSVIERIENDGTDELKRIKGAIFRDLQRYKRADGIHFVKTVFYLCGVK